MNQLVIRDQQIQTDRTLIRKLLVRGWDLGSFWLFSEIQMKYIEILTLTLTIKSRNEESLKKIESFFFFQNTDTVYNEKIQASII